MFEIFHNKMVEKTWCSPGFCHSCSAPSPKSYLHSRVRSGLQTHLSVSWTSLPSVPDPSGWKPRSCFRFLPLPALLHPELAPLPILLTNSYEDNSNTLSPVQNLTVPHSLQSTAQTPQFQALHGHPILPLQGHVLLPSNTRHRLGPCSGSNSSPQMYMSQS